MSASKAEELVLQNRCTLEFRTTWFVVFGISVCCARTDLVHSRIKCHSVLLSSSQLCAEVKCIPVFLCSIFGPSA